MHIDEKIPISREPHTRASSDSETAPDPVHRMPGRRRPYREDADLRAEYPINVEIGVILSLLVLIFAFRIDLPQQQGDFLIQMEAPETVDIEEIRQTEQETEPPPPPRPPAPVEVPNDIIIKDEPLDLDASLDLDEPVVPQGPPPPPEPEEDEAEEDEEDEIFVVVEERPELIGGMEALHGEIEYPEFAKRAGLEGTVYVEFVITPEGNVDDPRVTRGVHRLLDEEALRAVQQMKFEPGKQRGRPVHVRMALPVRFRIDR